MRHSRAEALSEEDLELRAAGFAALLGIAAVVLPAVAVIVGLLLT